MACVILSGRQTDAAGDAPHDGVGLTGARLMKTGTKKSRQATHQNAAQVGAVRAKVQVWEVLGLARCVPKSQQVASNRHNIQR